MIRKSVQPLTFSISLCLKPANKIFKLKTNNFHSILIIFFLNYFHVIILTSGSFVYKFLCFTDKTEQKEVSKTKKGQQTIK